MRLDFRVAQRRIGDPLIEAEQREDARKVSRGVRTTMRLLRAGHAQRSSSSSSSGSKSSAEHELEVANDLMEKVTEISQNCAQTAAAVLTNAPATA